MCNIWMGRSFDKKYLEKQVNEFMMAHECETCDYQEFVMDTSKHWQFTDKTPLILYECIVIYHA